MEIMQYYANTISSFVILTFWWYCSSSAHQTIVDKPVVKFSPYHLFMKSKRTDHTWEMAMSPCLQALTATAAGVWRWMIHLMSGRNECRAEWMVYLWGGESGKILPTSLYFLQTNTIETLDNPEHFSLTQKKKAIIKLIREMRTGKYCRTSGR